VAKKWKPGDVVRLASGGPDMTVQTVNEKKGGNESVECVWFNQDGKVVENDFLPETLVEARGSPKLS
jgi:uncharacterized protein YodC (DUF2158 family)